MAKSVQLPLLSDDFCTKLKKRGILPESSWIRRVVVVAEPQQVVTIHIEVEADDRLLEDLGLENA